MSISVIFCSCSSVRLSSLAALVMFSTLALCFSFLDIDSRKGCTTSGEAKHTIGLSFEIVTETLKTFIIFTGTKSFLILELSINTLVNDTSLLYNELGNGLIRSCEYFLTLGAVTQTVATWPARMILSTRVGPCIDSIKLVIIVCPTMAQRWGERFPHAVCTLQNFRLCPVIALVVG